MGSITQPIPETGWCGSELGQRFGAGNFPFSIEKLPGGFRETNWDHTQRALPNFAQFGFDFLIYFLRKPAPGTQASHRMHHWSLMNLVVLQNDPGNVQMLFQIQMETWNEAAVEVFGKWGHAALKWDPTTDAALAGACLFCNTFLALHGYNSLAVCWGFF